METSQNKILVLENVDHLDDNFRAYLKQYHENDDVQIVYGLSTNPEKEDITSKLAWCDEIAVCSSFGDYKQFVEFVTILPKFKNIKRIKILYLYTHEDYSFIYYLNDQKKSNPEVFEALKKFNESISIIEIFCKTYELENGNSSFKKFSYSFDLVPLYYNNKYNIFWLSKQPCPNWLNHDLFLFKSEVIIEDKEVKKIANTEFFTSTEKSYIKEFLEETEAWLNNLLESLEVGPSYFSEKETKELIKEKKRWLNLIPKIKTHIKRH